jgi:ankyrin repeat protein
MASRNSPNSTEVHEIFRRGDLGALRSAVEALSPAEDTARFPNCEAPFMSCSVLEYAIYHGPLALVEELLELGADPNYEDHDGFPSVIAALSTGRGDRKEIVGLLLAAGADIQQRGMNDYTPLHYAAAGNDVLSVELLVDRGADPDARTRIDDCATPLEEAENLGSLQAAALLRSHSAERP